MKLHIKLRGFPQCCFDATYLCHLAADMEMDQFQAVLHSLTLEEIECFEQFAGSQTKLAGIPSGLLPLAASRRSQFDTDTDIRLHIQLFCHAGNQFQFIHFLNDQENALTHFLCQQSKLDIAFVFISITDNKRVRIGIDGNYSMQFRFGTGFKSQIKFLAVADYFFNNRAHLVHFNRIDDKILGFISIFFRCLFKTIGSLFNTVIQNIRKTHQHRSRHITQLQLVDQFFQIDGYAIFSRCNNNMTFVINTKV